MRRGRRGDGRLHEQTVEYLKQRKQFGVAIGSFQALQHRAVDMLVAVEQARSMMLYATMMVAEPDRKLRARAVSAAKVQIARSGKFVGEQAIQLHGGIGVTEECAAGHFYRRLTMIELLFGDTAHHLSELARAGGVPDIEEIAADTRRRHDSVNCTVFSFSITIRCAIRGYRGG